MLDRAAAINFLKNFLWNFTWNTICLGTYSVGFEQIPKI